MNEQEQVGYNDTFDPSEQVDAEEQIATILFDHPKSRFTEDQAGDLGRRILYVVLRQFRPDLFDDYKPE